MTDDKIRLIALETAGAMADKLGERFDRVDERLGNVEKSIAVMEARDKKSQLSFGQWVKIICVVLGFLATAFGINWVAPI